MTRLYVWRLLRYVFLGLLLTALSGGCGGDDGEDSDGLKSDAEGSDALFDTDAGKEEGLEVRILSAPGETVSESQLPVVIEFELLDSTSSAQLECQLNSGFWDVCMSPQVYDGDMLEEYGEHIFRVRARDDRGNTSTNPAEARWFFVPPAPETRIDLAPSAVTSETTARFKYSADRADFFECNLDAGGWAVCPSPQITFRELQPGEHTFEVRATFMTVTDPSPARHEWRITRELDTGIDAAPDAFSSERNATFEFSGVNAASFECQLDAAGWELCSSPITYEGLEDGEYLFEVRAVSASGRLDDSPASHRWAVDTQAPTVTITSAPSASSASMTPIFEFTADEEATFECRLDGDAWSDCTSPHSAALTEYGAHEFEVRARDRAGNLSDIVSHQWTTEILWDAMSVGIEHTCGIQRDGSLWCWGRNSSSQLGAPTSANQARQRRPMPYHVDAGTVWSAVSIGNSHSCGIQENGTLWCWGSDYKGKLGLGSGSTGYAPGQAGSDDDWERIGAGGDHTCAIKSDGTLWCWGENTYGQLGDGTTDDHSSPTQVGADVDWSQVGAGDRSTCALKEDGTLWCWGANSHGELGLGDNLAVHTPTQVGASTQWRQVSVGNFNQEFSGGVQTCAVQDDGSLWCWGKLSTALFGASADTRVPNKLGAETDWSNVNVGGYGTCAVKNEGTLWCWGQNRSGVLGVSDLDPVDAPTQVGTRDDWSQVELAGYNNYGTPHRHTCALTSVGTLYCWGINNDGALGIGTMPDRFSPVRVGEFDDWEEVSAGYEQTCGLRSDATLWCWGHGDGHQLGMGNQWDYDAPKQQSAVNNWTSLSVGGAHSCATRSDGTLWCWGRSLSGELGVENSELDLGHAATPIQVGVDTDWRVAEASLHSFSVNGQTCAIKEDATLWCWGDNYGGFLGIGSTPTKQSTPTQVTTAAWTHIAMGPGHRCAIQEDATLWCWGYGSSGRLGQGSVANIADPARVGSGSDWQEVSAGNNFSCALKNNGTLWCWGSNSEGQIGDGSTDDRNLPVQVGSSSDWTSVAAGWQHVCAGRDDGTLWCWGDGGNGRLGSGSSSQQTAPAQVGAASDWLSPTLGSAHSCALDSERALWCWGANSGGQLGIESYLRVTPSEVVP